MFHIHFVNWFVFHQMSYQQWLGSRPRKGYWKRKIYLEKNQGSQVTNFQRFSQDRKCSIIRHLSSEGKRGQVEVGKALWVYWKDLSHKQVPLIEGSMTYNSHLKIPFIFFQFLQFGVCPRKNYHISIFGSSWNLSHFRKFSNSPVTHSVMAKKKEGGPSAGVGR